MVISSFLSICKRQGKSMDDDDYDDGLVLSRLGKISQQHNHNIRATIASLITEHKGAASS